MCFRGKKAQGSPPNLSYKASITIILNPNKDITRKEKYKPASLISIDAKIFPIWSIDLTQSQPTSQSITLRILTNWF